MTDQESPLFEDLHNKGIEIVERNAAREANLRADATYEALKDEIRERARQEVRDEGSTPAARHLRAI